MSGAAESNSLLMFGRTDGVQSRGGGGECPHAEDLSVTSSLTGAAAQSPSGGATHNVVSSNRRPPKRGQTQQPSPSIKARGINAMSTIYEVAFKRAPSIRAPSPIQVRNKLFFTHTSRTVFFGLLSLIQLLMYTHREVWSRNI